MRRGARASRSRRWTMRWRGTSRGPPRPSCRRARGVRAAIYEPGADLTWRIWPGLHAERSCGFWPQDNVRANGRCASSWHYRPATGRFWPHVSWRAHIRGTGRSVTPRRWRRRWWANTIPRCGIWRRTWLGGRPRLALAPAKRLRGLAHADEAGGHAAHDRVRRHVAGHDRVGADHRVVTHHDPAQDAGAVADPHVVADVDVPL